MNKIQVAKLAISSIDFEGENSIARSKRIWISQYFEIIPWKKEKPLLDIYQSREAKLVVCSAGKTCSQRRNIRIRYRA